MPNRKISLFIWHTYMEYVRKAHQSRNSCIKQMILCEVLCYLELKEKFCHQLIVIFKNWILPFIWKSLWHANKSYMQPYVCVKVPGHRIYIRESLSIGKYLKLILQIFLSPPESCITDLTLKHSIRLSTKEEMNNHFNNFLGNTDLFFPTTFFFSFSFSMKLKAW